jgi:hypothetical protein
MDNQRNQLSLLDAISIVSFLISLKNLDLNISQDDLQKAESELTQGLDDKINELHRHLAVQDEKLNIILGILQENGGVVIDKNKETS